MSYGPVQPYGVTIASGVTLSSAVDLQKSFARISVVVPSMTSSTDIYFQGSDTLAGTYRRINHSPNSVSSTAGAMFLNSSVTNCVVPLNNLHIRFVKIELSTAMTAASAAFSLICSD